MTTLARPRGHLTLTGSLLTQVEPADVLVLEAVTGVPGGGMVLSGESALGTAEHLLARGYPAPLLVDRQRYKGRRRLPAGHPFDPSWVARQARAGLPVVLPDAGYVAEGDLAGLRSVLVRCAAIPGGAAPLAVANWWLHGAGLALLLPEILDAPVPVALVIEHRADPLGVERILDGVLELLRRGVTLLPLRCDVSALGLLAHGALASACGARSSLRHLYPVTKGGGVPREEAGFWPAGLALHYRDLLYDATTSTPTDPRWRCFCGMCAGARLDRLQHALVGDVRRHNADSLLELRGRLLSTPPTGRRRLWASWCRDAVRTHASVSSGPVPVPCPRALELWQHR